MARIARVIFPRIPNHVTQRGNRWQPVFFCDDDYLAYIKLTGDWCSKCDVAIRTWCLMPNHLIAFPQTETGLARAIGEAHRSYTRRINFRENWQGHLWQERFASFPMDEFHLLAAPFPLNDMVPRWDMLLRLSSNEELKTLKLHERTGRPLGNDSFVTKIEQTLGRILHPQKPEPKKKVDS